MKITLIENLKSHTINKETPPQHLHLPNTFQVISEKKQDRIDTISISDWKEIRAA